MSDLDPNVIGWFQHEIWCRGVTRGVGGVADLFKTLDEDELPKDRSGRPITWTKFQGEYLGIFVGMHYFWDWDRNYVVPLCDKEAAISFGIPEPLSLPVLKHGSERGWEPDDKESSNNIRDTFTHQRRFGSAEFLDIFVLGSSWRLCSYPEQLFNIILCEDGEISTFLFEWLLRCSLTEPSTSDEDFLQELAGYKLEEKAHHIAKHLKLIGDQDDLTKRGIRMCMWLRDTIVKEQKEEQNRFAAVENGQSWSSQFEGSLLEELNRDLQGCDQITVVARQMAAAIGRSVEDLEIRVRFNLSGHYKVRTVSSDTGEAKHLIGFPLLRDFGRAGNFPLAFFLGTIKDIDQLLREPNEEQNSHSRFKELVRWITATMSMISCQVVAIPYAQLRARRSGDKVTQFLSHALITPIARLKPGIAALLNKLSLTYRNSEMEEAREMILQVDTQLDDIIHLVELMYIINTMEPTLVLLSPPLPLEAGLPLEVITSGDISEAIGGAFQSVFDGRTKRGIDKDKLDKLASIVPNECVPIPERALRAVLNLGPLISWQTLGVFPSGTYEGVEEVATNAKNALILLILPEMAVNAVRYADEESPSVSVRVALDNEGSSLAISVFNNGDELSDEEFESPGEKLAGRAGEKRRALGMLLNKRLIELFGWKLRKEGSTAIGTKLSVIIPLKESL